MTNVASSTGDTTPLFRLFLQLTRVANNVTEYWNFATGVWGTANAGTYYYPPNLSDSTWAVTDGLPTGTNLPVGSYSLKATTYDRSNNSTQTTNTFSIVAPPAPVDITATGGSSQVSLQWTASAGATGYEVFRSTTAGTSGTLLGAAPTTATTSFTDNGLINGTTYYYTVTAKNGSDSSTPSIQISATPLAAPANLVALTGNSQVSLTWSAVTGAASYRLYRSTSAGTFNYTTSVASTTATSFTDTGLTNNTTYYYVVRAASANASISNATSNVVTVTPFIDTQAPTTVTVTNPPATGVAPDAFYRIANKADFTTVTGTVKETAGAGQGISGVDRVGVILMKTIRGVTYYWNGTTWGTTTTSAQLTSTLSPVVNESDSFTWTLTGTLPVGNDLQPARYAVRIYAYDKAGNLDSTLTRYFYIGTDRTDPTATLAVPAAGASLPGLTQISGTVLEAQGPAGEDTSGVGRAVITLTRPAAAGGVEYWKSTAPVGWQSALVYLIAIPDTQAPGTWSITTGLPTGANLPNGNYEIRMFGDDHMFLRSPTIIRNFSIGIPGSPTNLVATAGSGLVNLAWSASSGAASYQVYRSTTSGTFNYATADATVTTTSFKDEGLTNGITYYYVVRAVNAAGASTSSNQALATPIPGPLTAPSNFSAKAGNQRVRLTWTAATDVTGYQLYRSDSTNGIYTALGGSITSLSHLDTGLTNGTPYYYKVAGKRNNEIGPLSSVASATPGSGLLSITMTSPVNNASLTSLPSFAGSVGVNGLPDHIVVTIQRRSDNKFWDSATSSWVVNEQTLTANLANGQWNLATGIPGVTDLISGYYDVIATVYDGTGESAFVAATVLIDRTAPTISFLTPSAGNRSELLGATGRAGDNIGGSGVESVIFALKRLSDNWYWHPDQKQWTADVTTGSTSYKSGFWTALQNLPRSSQLPDGSYDLIATVSDRAGNTNMATTSIILTKTSPTVTWSASSAISCGGIRWPKPNAPILAGTEGVLSSYLATDLDGEQSHVNGQLVAAGTYSDPCSYTWAASGGSFVNNRNSGQTVAWVAPTTPGQYVLTLTVDDANALNQGTGDGGTRTDAARGANDPAQTFTVTVTVQ